MNTYISYFDLNLNKAKKKLVVFFQDVILEMWLMRFHLRILNLDVILGKVIQLNAINWLLIAHPTCSSQLMESSGMSW